MKTLLLILLTLLLLNGCATPTVPLAITCPPPPPVPDNLKQPVSTDPSLSQQFNDLLLEFRASLTKAAIQ